MISRLSGMTGPLALFSLKTVVTVISNLDFFFELSTTYFKSGFFLQALQSEVFSAWHIHGRFAAHELHHDTLEEFLTTDIALSDFGFHFLLFFSRSAWPMPTRIFSNWSTTVLISRREIEWNIRLAGGLIEEWKIWCDHVRSISSNDKECSDSLLTSRGNLAMDPLRRLQVGVKNPPIVVKASSMLHRVSCQIPNQDPNSMHVFDLLFVVLVVCQTWGWAADVLPADTRYHQYTSKGAPDKRGISLRAPGCLRKATQQRQGQVCFANTQSKRPWNRW